MKKTAILFRVLFFLSVITLSVTIKAQVPAWQWAKSGAGADSDYGNSIGIDDAGNVYVTGYYYSPTITFGSTVLTNTSSGWSDIYVIKYSPNGTILWTKNIGGGLSEDYAELIVDNDGNVYVTGFFNSSTVTVDAITLVNSGYWDFFLIKYDTYGNVIYAKDEGGLLADRVSSMRVDNSGNLYVLGTFTDSALVFGTLPPLLNTEFATWKEDIFLLKCDSIGNPVWAKKMGGITSDYSADLIIDALGNIVLTGSFQSLKIGFDADTLYKSPGFSTTSDMFMASYDPSGNELWANGVGSSGSEGGSLLSLDDSGNIYLVGGSNSDTLIFDSDTLFNPSVFYSKCDISGNFLWVKNIGATNTVRVSALVPDHQGNFNLVGSFMGTNLFFPNDTLYNSHPLGFFEDIYIFNFDQNGNENWSRKQSGGDLMDYAFSAVSDTMGNLFIAGSFQNSTSIFGNDTLYNNSTDYDVFVAKLMPYFNVWPGDTDNNKSVDNNDLLPIGLNYGYSGIPRDSISNIWQANVSIDWNMVQANGFDVKHADCNGDSIINDNDTLAINLNFSSAHAMSNDYSFERLSAPDIYFVIGGGPFEAGDWVNAELWIGTSTDPVSDLYGISFDIDYNLSMVESGTSSLTFPSGWLGTQGVDAIKINKIDILANKAYGAITRIDHMNANGFGKIAELKFQLNTSFTAADTIHLSVSSYVAVDSAGMPQVFDPQPLSLPINFVGIEEMESSTEMIFYPNPSNDIINIEIENFLTVQITDMNGKILITSGKKQIDISALAKGVYSVIIISDKNKIVKKLVKM